MNIIGHEPAIAPVVLIDGQDLTHLFVGALPPGSVVEWRVTDRDRRLLFGVWPVTSTADGWLLNVEAADHATIPNGARHRLFVTYPSGGRYCWVAGPVGRSLR